MYLWEDLMPVSMFRFSPIFILQIFCLYHAYTKKVDYLWYLLIILFPLIGSLIYLYKHVYNRQSIDHITEGMRHTLNRNYKVDQLEKQIKFSDTIQNRQALAEEHTELGNHIRAIELFESCLSGMYANDARTIKGLIKNYYLIEDYQSVIRVAGNIEDKSLFNRSKEKTALAWALHHTGDTEAAINCFEEMDLTFANFEHRLEFAKFLIHLNRAGDARSRLNGLLEEIDSMDPYEQKLKRPITREIQQLVKTIRASL